MKPWMLQSRRAQTGTAAPITTSHVVALEDIVYGGGGSHGGGGYWELGPDWSLATTSLIPSQAASQARAVAISNGLVLGEQGYGIIFLDTVGMTPSATILQYSTCNKDGYDHSRSRTLHIQARVDFWGGAAVGDGVATMEWRSGGLPLAEGEYFGSWNYISLGRASTGETPRIATRQYLITKDKDQFDPGPETVPHTVAGLVLTPPQASLPPTRI